MTLSEDDIIRRFFAKDFHDRSANGQRPDVVIGIGDDAAALRVPSGMELISAIDTIVEGVHFPDQFDASDVGYRVLAVNLSDLAAMGAQPAWALLSLSLPAVDEKWLASFSAGFFELAGRHGVALIGGDLVKGPLMATVTIMGYCPEGAAITRGGATPGDAVYVSGSPGAASLGLHSLMSQQDQFSQFERYFRRPVPRVLEGMTLRGIASSMIDISDGLLKDASHLAVSSAVRISLDADVVASLTTGGLQPALSGGDDYELLFTVPADQQDALNLASATWNCACQCVGRVEPGRGVIMSGHDLTTYTAYDHFAHPSG